MSAVLSEWAVAHTFVARSKRRDLIEIAVAYFLILIVVWTPRPWQWLFWLIAVLGVSVMVGMSFDGRRAMGLRASNFLRSLWVAGVALLLSAIAVSIAARLHTLRDFAGPLELMRSFFWYAVWAGTQEFLLLAFFLSRLLRLMSRPQYAAFAAAGLFAAAHLPNPVLSMLSIVWGTLACLLFLRYRNLYPLAIAHAILGITIAVSVPGPVVHNMRVGLGYLRYHKVWVRPQAQRSQRDQMASTDAWVMADAPTRRPDLQARP